MSCPEYDVVGAHVCTVISLLHFVMHTTNSVTHFHIKAKIIKV